MELQNSPSDIVVQQFDLASDGFRFFSGDHAHLNEMKDHFGNLIETSLMPRCEILDVELLEISECIGRIRVMGTRQRVGQLLRSMKAAGHLHGRLDLQQPVVVVDAGELVEA